MGDVIFRPSDFLVDKVFGKVGTPERERMEAELKKEVDHYFICEALKSANGKLYETDRRKEGQKG